MMQDQKNRTYFIAMSSWNSSNPVSQQFQRLAEELVKQGSRVIILMSKSQDSITSLRTNMEVLFWPSKRPTKLSDGWFLYKAVRKYKPVCLLSNFAATNWMMIIGKLTGVPIRVTWYHTLQKAILIDSRVSPIITKFYIFRKIIIYQLATHLVPVSYAAAEDIQNTFYVIPGKCKVIHNLLSDPLSSVFSREIERQEVITCVGRLDESKGQDVLIKALHLLHKQFPNVCVRIIGDGGRKSHLISLAASLGIGGNVVFTGRISHDNVLRELSNSYLTVHPTRSESFGYAVLESIAVGTPVVASNVGGIPEIIRDGVEGFLVPPDSPEALANAIEKILKSPELRETLSKNARQRFLSTFELAKGVQDIITWLTATIDAHT